jgi:hypothetical protein
MSAYGHIKTMWREVFAARALQGEQLDFGNLIECK